MSTAPARRLMPGVLNMNLGRTFTMCVRRARSLYFERSSKMSWESTLTLIGEIWPLIMRRDRGVAG